MMKTMSEGGHTFSNSPRQAHSESFIFVQSFDRTPQVYQSSSVAESQVHSPRVSEQLYHKFFLCCDLLNFHLNHS